MKSDDELRDGLVAIAEEIDESTASAVHGSARRHAVRRKRAVSTVAFVAGVACAAVVVLGLSLTVGTDNDRQTASPPSAAREPDFIPANRADDEPCPGGRAVSLDRLARVSATPVWLPDHELASPKALASQWNCGDGAPMLVFDSGVTIAFEPGWSLANPHKRWSDMAAQWGAGRVETVLGEPAFVLPRSEKMGPLGEVLVVIDHTLIRVHGDGTIPVSELVDMVDTIDVAAPYRN